MSRLSRRSPLKFAQVITRNFQLNFQGMSHLHKLNIVHRALTSKNVVVMNDFSIKIAGKNLQGRVMTVRFWKHPQFVGWQGD